MRRKDSEERSFGVFLTFGGIPNRKSVTSRISPRHSQSGNEDALFGNKAVFAFPLLPDKALWGTLAGDQSPKVDLGVLLELKDGVRMGEKASRLSGAPYTPYTPAKQIPCCLLAWRYDTCRRMRVLCIGRYVRVLHESRYFALPIRGP